MFIVASTSLTVTVAGMLTALVIALGMVVVVLLAVAPLVLALADETAASTTASMPG